MATPAIQPSLDTLTNRNLQNAFQKVSTAWFPVNPDLLAKIQKSLDEGAYDLDVEFLVAEIQTDFALFTYCLREVLVKIQSKAITVPPKSNPIELLTLVGLDVLKPILRGATPEAISSHSMGDITDFQAKRFQESIVSATTAEVIADQKNFGTGLGFSTGLLRQLGLTLIAWNYPQVYRRTLESIPKGQTLDQALTRTLGFSPSLLGIAVVRRWGVSPEVRLALGDREATNFLRGDKAQQLEAMGSTLAKICEVGEALARAANPEQYPTAVSDWNTALKAINAQLGPDGLTLVQDKIKLTCENYLNLAPDIFKNVIEMRPDAGIQPRSSKELFRTNPYAERCAPPLREGLRELYSRINPDSISKDNIVFLTRTVVPVSGFNRGCIFLLEPETLMLVPRLNIGTATLKDFTPLSCAPTVQSNDPVVSAYRCNTPIVERVRNTEAVSISFIACVVGQAQRAGVLYLEFAEPANERATFDHLIHFKAINQALNDCLNLQ